MKKFYKITGIIAGVSFAIGLICLIIGIGFGASGVIVLAKNGFTIKQNMERYQYSNENESPFTTINIETEFAEIYILESKSDKYEVKFNLTCTEEEATFTNENGVLTIKDVGSDERFTINIFNIFGRTKKDTIYIYVPKGEQLDKIDVDSNVGDIEVMVPSGAKHLKVNADVGEICIHGGLYEQMELKADVGDIETEDVEVSGKVIADANVGEVQLAGKFACDINVSADVGSVSIATDVPKEQYRYRVTADVGEVRVFNIKNDGADNEVEGNEDGMYLIEVDASLGSVDIESTVGK